MGICFVKYFLPIFWFLCVWVFYREKMLDIYFFQYILIFHYLSGLAFYRSLIVALLLYLKKSYLYGLDFFVFYIWPYCAAFWLQWCKNAHIITYLILFNHIQKYGKIKIDNAPKKTTI